MIFTERIKSSLIHFILVAFLCSVIIFSLPIEIDFILNKFSKISDNDAWFSESFMLTYLLCIAYGIFSYSINLVTLKEIKKKGWRFLPVQMVLDILIVPLSILILVLYNNFKYSNLGNVSLDIESLLNIYMVVLLVSIKHVIILIANKRFIVKRKKPA